VWTSGVVLDITRGAFCLGPNYAEGVEHSLDNNNNNNNEDNNSKMKTIVSKSKDSMKKKSNNNDNNKVKLGVFSFDAGNLNQQQEVFAPVALDFAEIAKKGTNSFDNNNNSPAAKYTGVVKRGKKKATPSKSSPKQAKDLTDAMSKLSTK
jgi:hypothetical protein